MHLARVQIASKKSSSEPPIINFLTGSFHSFIHSIYIRRRRSSNWECWPLVQNTVLILECSRLSFRCQREDRRNRDQKTWEVFFTSSEAARRRKLKLRLRLTAAQQLLLALSLERSAFSSTVARNLSPQNTFTRTLAETRSPLSSI